MNPTPHFQVKIKTFDVEELKPHPKNPKLHIVEFIEGSIQEFGYLSPIVVDEDGLILAGHGRLKALQKMGGGKVDCVVVEGLSESQKESYLIADNRATELGGIDKDMLKGFSDELLRNWGKFDEDFLAKLRDIKLGDDELIEDIPPEIPVEPKAKYGDVYQLGRHRLLCGDATKREDVEKLMDGAFAGMLLTDPPYNVAYRGGRGKVREKIQNDNFKHHEEFYKFLHDFFVNVRPFVKGDVYTFMSSRELHTLRKAFEDGGGYWSTFIIWVKNHFTLGRSNYHSQYEPILYGWFQESSHYWSGVRNLTDVYKDEIKQEVDGSIWLKMGDIQTDIWEYPKPTQNKKHPTMKPIKLLARAIQNSSQPKHIVLDCFGGSGSTMIACEQLGRTCYMMELDCGYMDVILERWAKFTGETPVKLNS